MEKNTQGGDPQPPASGFPLLTTKLYIPQPRAELVPRPQLVARLNAGLGRKLTLISAPTGSGKTTLMGEWARQQGLPTAWVSLDARDNDPERFITYVIAALQTIQEGLGQAALESMQSLQPASTEAVLTSIINEISGLPGDFILILDDFHLIDNAAVHQALNFLVEFQPPQMHLVISSQVDPSLELAHLRARSQVTEIRAPDLRFSQEETAEFLNQVMGLKITAGDVTALEARTEGWIAGLQLAALALQARLALHAEEDISGFIGTFSGGSRYVLDYLAEEVLSRQPAEVRSFLLKTSILERMNGPLCDQLTAQENGQSMLEKLNRSNLFILPLDDEHRWYRYHQLFAEFLRNQLQKSDIAQAALHRRASEWFESRGYPDEAVQHALAIPDYERASNLILPLLWPMIQRGRQATLRQWMQAVPDRVRKSQPEFAIGWAWVLLFSGEVEAYEGPLAEAEAAWQARDDQAGLGQVLCFRANVARLRGDMGRAIELAQQALERIPAGDPQQRGIAAIVLGSGYLHQGALEKARTFLRQARDISQESGNLIGRLIAMNRLGDVQRMQGQLHRAGETFRQVLQLSGERPLWQRIEAHIALGDLAREWNRLDEAAAHLQEALELVAQTGREVYAAQGYLAQARIAQARADSPAARDAFEKALDVARRFGHTDVLRRIQAYLARFWLAEGDLAAVERWISEASPARVDLNEPLWIIEALTLASVHLAKQHPDAALDLLATAKEKAEADGLIGDLIEILVLEAITCRALGKQERAASIFQRALSLAWAETYVRTFLDQGEAVKDLIQQASPTSGELAAYSEKLLEALGEGQSPSQPAEQHLVEPLSKRELEVLQIIARGATNQEIANELVISIGTAKKHVSNIIGKLGVSNRMQAAARARDMGLI